MDDRILDSIENNHKDLVRRVDSMTDLLRQHIESPGHVGDNQRIKALEDELHTQKGRPLATWQIVSGVIALLFSLGFLGLSSFSDALTLIMFIRSLHP